MHCTAPLSENSITASLRALACCPEIVELFLLMVDPLNQSLLVSLSDPVFLIMSLGVSIGYFAASSSSLS